MGRSGSPGKPRGSDASSIDGRPRASTVVPSLPKLQTPSLLRRPAAKTYRQLPSARARATPRTSRSMAADSQDDLDSPPYSRAGSVCDSSVVDSRSVLGDDEAESLDSGADNIKVLVRIRPLTEAEAEGGVCVTKLTSKRVRLQHGQQEPHTWSFDFVAGETATQDDMFQVAGLPLVEHCLAGMNCSILAYGQTGSGKTHTMQGCLTDADQRGLSLRVLDRLFARIAEEEAAAGRDNLRFTCKCSFLEIYNETAGDLLNPEAANLQLREDVQRGCFVEGLSEAVALNAEDAAALMRAGARNRTVGQTRLNRESSRSHSVFTCTVESAARSQGGLTTLRRAALNLVDLAGSERTKASGARGGQLREACHINSSLSTLGRVISELVAAQRSGRKRHIPFRESRLTMLLQDSLGGNAKSAIIACVSPAAAAAGETLSTLQFASRAKRIRTAARVNQDMQAASVELLKRELQRLGRELELARGAAPEPLQAELAALSAQLQEARREEEEARTAAAVGASQARLARAEARWAEERVAALEGERAEALAALAAELGSAAADVPAAQPGAVVELVQRLCGAQCEALQQARQALAGQQEASCAEAARREEAAAAERAAAVQAAEAARQEQERAQAERAREAQERAAALRRLQTELDAARADLARERAEAARRDEELGQERAQAAELRVAGDCAARRQAAEAAQLQSENRALRASLAEARRREGDAVLRSSQLKSMVEGIGEIIAWARSPAPTPAGAPPPASFRRGASPRAAAHNSLNPLFAAPPPHPPAAQLWSRPGGFLPPLEAPNALLASPPPVSRISLQRAQAACPDSAAPAAEAEAPVRRAQRPSPLVVPGVQ